MLPEEFRLCPAGPEVLSPKNNMVKMCVRNSNERRCNWIIIILFILLEFLYYFLTTCKYFDLKMNEFLTL